MKQILFLTLLLSLFSCKNSENNSENVVKKLLEEINSTQEKIDKSNLSKEMSDLISDIPTSHSENWKLSTEKTENGTFIVTANSKTTNLAGLENEINQKFEVKEGKIINSQHFFHPDVFQFEIVNKEFDNFWDIEKMNAYREVEKNVIISYKSPTINPFSNSLSGFLKIENNSKFDIKNLRILVEHFENDGTQVKTDEEWIDGILRAGGKQKLEWYTRDCDNCSEQKFKILFRNTDEANK